MNAQQVAKADIVVDDEYADFPGFRHARSWFPRINKRHGTNILMEITARLTATSRSDRCGRPCGKPAPRCATAPAAGCAACLAAAVV
jgi:hypothetical protein